MVERVFGCVFGCGYVRCFCTFLDVGTFVVFVRFWMWVRSFLVAYLVLDGTFFDNNTLLYNIIKNNIKVKNIFSLVFTLFVYTTHHRE
jgi:hypothetical protein